MKRLMLLTFVMAIMSGLNPLQAQVGMVVHGVDGSTVETPLENVKTMLFQDNGFRLTGWSGQTLRTYNFTDVRKIVFSNTETGISQVAADGLKLQADVQGQQLKVTGWPVDHEAALTVYAVNGQRMYSQPSWKGEEVRLPGLPAGVYLLKLNEETLKFIVR